MLQCKYLIIYMRSYRTVIKIATRVLGKRSKKVSLSDDRHLFAALDLFTSFTFGTILGFKLTKPQKVTITSSSKSTYFIGIIVFKRLNFRNSFNMP